MTEWIRYQPEVRSGPGFSFEHPADWRVGNVEGSSAIQFTSPDEAAFLYMSAFAKPGGTLEDFAAFRFAVQAEVFAPVGPAVPLRGSGWNGLLQEAEDKEKARRVLLCANSGDVFVTLSLYTSSAEYLARRSHYGRLFTSLEFGDAPATETGVNDLATLLAGFALGHAAWSASDLPKGELLVPLALVVHGDDRQLQRFEAPTQEQAIAKAQAAMAEATEEADAWAFAHEGLVTLDGQKVDALVANCWAKGMTAAATFIQPFEPYATRQQFRMIGEPFMLVGGRMPAPEAAEPTIRKLLEGVRSHPKAGPLWSTWC